MDEGKYKNWVFTWNATNSGDLIPEKQVQLFLKEIADNYIFQKEKGETTERLHYQGAFRLKIRTRKKTILNNLRSFLELLFSLSTEKGDTAIDEFYNNFTVTSMKGTWSENCAYCTKTENRVGDPISSSSLKQYTGDDVSFLSKDEERYPWQRTLISKILDPSEVNIQTPDDRTITWVWDPIGNSGKSKFVKYLCSNYSDIVKIPFGTSSQLRSSIISAGARSVYFIDIPRTLGEDDSLASLISVLEDMKNGFLVTSMYGKYEQLMFDPPMVIVFSNQLAPQAMMSGDRWEQYRIDRMFRTLEDIN